MIPFVILAVLISAIICFYRVIIGPTVFDRIAAADSMGIMFVVILVLLGLYFKREIFIDVALVFGLLLFVDILIMAKYFGKKEEIKNE